MPIHHDVAAAVSADLRAMGVDVSSDDVHGVIGQMADIDESLILADPVYVSQMQHRILLRYKIQRGRRRAIGTNALKRPASTLACRGGRSKSRRSH